MKKILITGLFVLMISACGTENTTEVTGESYSAVNDSFTELKNTLATLPRTSLDQTETDGLKYMREEEKLAQNVYLNASQYWSNNVFENIAASESTHTSAIILLLQRYQIVDPAENNGEGIFTNPDLQNLYDKLAATSSLSVIDALLVGAEIEEIDLIDIQKYIDQLVQNPDIELVYQNLMKGSRNHLRSFVKNLQQQGISYQPIHLDQTTYEVIVNSPIERGSNT